MIKFSSEIAANRFGLGARPGDIASIKSDPQGWLLNQLQAKDGITFEHEQWHSSLALESLVAYRQRKKDEKKAPEKAASMQMMDSMQEMSDMEGAEALSQNMDALAPKKYDTRKAINNASRQLAIDTLHESLRSEDSLQYRLLDFFSNHFSVSANNIRMNALAPTLEREAIAPHINGYFGHMLLSVSMHPTMLIYLNNEQSIGPDTKRAKRRKSAGLNENLAREILELHTLGVHGGYTQGDVRELAMAITGWSVGNPQKNEKAGFAFREINHQPGKRTVVGKTYADEGFEQGKKILFDLSIHPSTARFVSHKIARHFIADEPSESLVNSMRDTWIASNGHLKEVITAMIQHKDSWSEALQKFKTPREYVVSACRAAGRFNMVRPGAQQILTTFGQRPFDAGSPKGYSDLSVAWLGGEAMITRIEWAQHFAKFVKSEPAKFASNALGDLIKDETSLHMKRAESRSTAIALLLMSPEFQRR